MITGILSSGSDVTERRFAEQALAESEAKFRSLVTGSEEIVYIISNGGIFILSEGKGLKALGLKPGEVVGLSAFDIYKDYPEMLEIFQRVFKGETVQSELEINGLHFRSWFTPYKNHSGEITGLMGLSVNNTQHKKDEKALRESEEKYRLIVEYAHDGIEISQGGKIIFSNTQFANMLGYTVPELQNIPSSQIFTDETILAQKQRKDLIAQGQSVPHVYKCTMKKKMGDEILVEVRFEIIEYQGEPAVFAIIHDIAEQHRTHTALAESELKFRLLADYTQDWEYWINEEGQFNYISPACERITGYTVQEFMDNPELRFQIAVLDDQAALHEHYHGENEMDMDVVRLQYEIITKAGDHRWIEHHCSPVFDNEDNYIGRRVNNRDITHRKQEQIALEQSTSRLQAIYNGIPEAIVVVNLDRDIISVNNKFVELFGISENQVLGKKTSIIYESDAEFKRQGELRYNLAAEEQTEPYIVKYKTSAGRIFPGETLGVPVLDTAGVKIGFLGVIRDIADKYEMESKLRQAQKLEAVGIMVGGIAHDFNNILQSMFLYGEVVSSQLEDGSELKEDFQFIMDDGERARKLVKQILTFSRKSDTVFKAQTIHEVILEAISFERASTPANIEYIQNIDVNCGRVLCDKTQIHQIVLNLCNNAKQAIGEKQGSIQVTLSDSTALTDDAKTLELTISDTGPGMDTETLERVFDPFFTTKEIGHGTGLGLSIIHGIVEMMNGTIKAASEIGHGTMFTINIPYDDSVVTIDHQDKKREIGPDRYSVLLVDDEKTIITAGKVMLTQAGHKVDTAETGEEAFELFQNKIVKYDIIVTDLSMPKLSGVKLAQKIRKIDSRIPIILSSGNLDIGEQAEYIDKGISSFL